MKPSLASEYQLEARIALHPTVSSMPLTSSEAMAVAAAACNAFSEIVSVTDAIATQKLRCNGIRDGHNFSICERPPGPGQVMILTCSAPAHLQDRERAGD